MPEYNPQKYRKAPKPETVAEGGYIKPIPKSLIRKERRDNRPIPERRSMSFEQMYAYAPIEKRSSNRAMGNEIADVHPGYERLYLGTPDYFADEEDQEELPSTDYAYEYARVRKNMRSVDIEILDLVLRSGRTQRDIAAELKISQGAVSHAFMRAQQNMLAISKIPDTAGVWKTVYRVCGPQVAVAMRVFFSSTCQSETARKMRTRRHRPWIGCTQPVIRLRAIRAVEQLKADGKPESLKAAVVISWTQSNLYVRYQQPYMKRTNPTKARGAKSAIIRHTYNGKRHPKAVPAQTETARWFQENSGQVEAIIRYQLKGWDEWKDVSQYVARRMLQNDALSKYEKGKSSFRTFLYTTVTRAMMSYFKGKKHMWNVPMCEYDGTYMSPTGTGWVDRIDAKLDIAHFVAWCKKHARKSQWRVVNLWVKDTEYIDIATKLGLSRQHCHMAVKECIQRYRERLAE